MKFVPLNEYRIQRLPSAPYVMAIGKTLRQAAQQMIVRIYELLP